MLSPHRLPKSSFTQRSDVMAQVNLSLLPESVGHTTTFSFDNNYLINTTHVNCKTNCTSSQENDDTVRYFCLPKYFSETCSTPSSNEVRLIEIFCTAVFVQNDIIVYIALALGMPGSIFALVTVSSLKYSPGMVYLGSLAVSDFLALVIASIILVFFKVADENESVLLKLKFIYAAIQLKNMAQYIRSMASSTMAPSSRSDAMETKLTKMMLLTVACFFVFACPFGFIQCFDRIKFWYLKFDLCHLNESIYIYLFYTLYAVSFLNHAVNFYIYCACAKGFRKQFVRVVFSKCCAKN
ncbi:hypothetical protein ElyMa_000194500 [Elysia marginata]|uniref:G-protein coupled receptors family 1 profile domain-containing protein n=1 Tax=Elysia marginata TaxID=1093978 RepID=A0AAV4EXZ3_9GAST|nr:hypothetical protein ElyMa_000194500 [Elysia marginata]